MRILKPFVLQEWERRSAAALDMRADDSAERPFTNEQGALDLFVGAGCVTLRSRHDHVSADHACGLIVMLEMAVPRGQPEADKRDAGDHPADGGEQRSPSNGSGNSVIAVHGYVGSYFAGAALSTQPRAMM